MLSTIYWAATLRRISDRWTSSTDDTSSTDSTSTYLIDTDSTSTYWWVTIPPLLSEDDPLCYICYPRCMYIVVCIWMTEICVVSPICVLSAVIDLLLPAWIAYCFHTLMNLFPRNMAQVEVFISEIKFPSQYLPSQCDVRYVRFLWSVLRMNGLLSSGSSNSLTRRPNTVGFIVPNRDSICWIFGIGLKKSRVSRHFSGDFRTGCTWLQWVAPDSSMAPSFLEHLLGF
jgi:hypothetical protein